MINGTLLTVSFPKAHSEHIFTLFLRPLAFLNLQTGPILELQDDVRITFKCSSSTVPRGYNNCAFYFWWDECSFCDAHCKILIYNIHDTLFVFCTGFTLTFCQDQESSNSVGNSWTIPTNQRIITFTRKTFPLKRISNISIFNL